MLNVKRIGTNGPHSQSEYLPSTPMNRSSASENGPVYGEGVIPNEGPGPLVAATMPMHLKMLASLTVYGELCDADLSEDFAPVRMRLQQEWTFDGGFVSNPSITFLDTLLIHH